MFSTRVVITMRGYIYACVHIIVAMCEYIFVCGIPIMVTMCGCMCVGIIHVIVTNVQDCGNLIHPVVLCFGAT